jgi:uroporphyrinogen decarboxylase
LDDASSRYLPEFIALRDDVRLLYPLSNSELAAEITVQPIRRIAPDAAILFSDILVIPQAMELM